jgi:Contractile injection system tube protein
MEETVKVTRAELRALNSDGTEDKGKTVHVQFNPETLKVSFANQVKTDGNQQGTSSNLYVGQGTTKMSVQLWFDVTAPLREEFGEYKGVIDVRELTEKVAYFIKPKDVEVKNEKGQSETRYVPPGVRFIWGTFQFDGIMESLEESLEFFSPEGRPLRASVSLNLSQQKIEFIPPAKGGAPPGAGAPGTSPLAEAPSNSSLQKLAAGLGKAEEWQRIARNNGIENPRMLAPGQLINMNVPKFGR